MAWDDRANWQLLCRNTDAANAFVRDIGVKLNAEEKFAPFLSGITASGNRLRLTLAGSELLFLLLPDDGRAPDSDSLRWVHEDLGGRVVGKYQVRLLQKALDEIVHLGVVIEDERANPESRFWISLDISPAKKTDLFPIGTKFAEAFGLLIQKLLRLINDRFE